MSQKPDDTTVGARFDPRLDPPAPPSPTVGVRLDPRLDPPTPPSPRLNKTSITIIGGGVLLLIIFAIIIRIAANNIQASNSVAAATAHANETAQAKTAATTHTDATASAIMTATVVAGLINPYLPGNGRLALNDPLTDNNPEHSWYDNGTNCTFTGGSYQASISQLGFVEDCLIHAMYFSDFACQVQMTITQGDAGGLVIRSDGSHSNYYYFRVGLDGRYELDLFDGSGLHRIGGGSSSAIHKQLYQVNVLGVVARGNTINLYVNMRHLGTFQNSRFSQGRIGVAAEDDNDATQVSFNDLKVWVL